MSKITEQAVTSFLQNKIASLQKKLSKQQTLLSALAETHDLKAVGLKKKDKKVIKKAQSKVKPVKTKAKKEKSGKGKAKAATPITLSLDEQIKVALTAGPAFRQAITDAVVAGNPGADAQKLGKDIEAKLREMVKNNELQAEKQGAKLSYSLVPAATA